MDPALAKYLKDPKRHDSLCRLWTELMKVHDESPEAFRSQWKALEREKPRTMALLSHWLEMRD